MANKPVGNAAIGQSGGPTVVINQSLVGLIQAASKRSEIKNVYGALHGVKGILNQEFIDLKKQNTKTLEVVAQTPCAALGSVRKKPTEEECVKIFETFRAYEIRYFYYIGGNDSAETANLLAQIAARESYELCLYHVPKTIDNDLLVTDHCPGYGSAAKFVAQAFMGDDLDNRSLPGIKVNIVMGRHAGFLTAASLLARRKEGDGPHLIYLPERVFSKEKFLADVDAVYKKLGRCLIAVSEGIHDASGKTILETREKDAHGNVQLSGTGALGDYLADLIRANLGEKLRVRADTFGYLQRSFAGVVSEVDASEARRVGEDAIRYSLTDAATGSVAMRRTGEGDRYGIETFVTPLSSVAKKTRALEESYLKGDSDVAESYRAYAAPLVGPLPELALLDRTILPKRS